MSFAQGIRGSAAGFAQGSERDGGKDCAPRRLVSELGPFPSSDALRNFNGEAYAPDPARGFPVDIPLPKIWRQTPRGARAGPSRNVCLPVEALCLTP